MFIMVSRMWLQLPRLILTMSLEFFPFLWRLSNVEPCAGVQIAYYAIIFSQFSMMVLSVLLAIGVYTVSLFSRFTLRRIKNNQPNFSVSCSASFQENSGLVVPWLIGILTFISFEALGLVYANVLKDQIFGVRRLLEVMLVSPSSEELCGICTLLS
jgi:hypothetical protein